MNLSEIEKFAVSTRRNLSGAVDAALSKLGFTADGKTPEKPIALPGGCVYQGDTISDETFVARWESLNSLISREGRKIAVERAAYTWFNRLVAIRILAKRHLIVPQLEWAENEAYVPLIVYRMRTGGGTPNLTSAEDAALAVVRNDPTKTREQFAILIGAFCRETPILNAAFGEIDDWTTLLVPGNLLSEGGLVDALNNSELLSDEDYSKDELIGWLYQYYIAERKAEVYDGFAKNKKAGVGEIPAATQIFTPNWIAKYLVENTIKDDETSFIDPCCGSGHMLLEGFKLLLNKYEEVGYSKRDAVKRIFETNLTGIDLDPRARQLSTFALLIAASREDESFSDAKILPRIFDTSTPPADISETAVAKALDTTKKDVVYDVAQALALLKEVGDNFGSLIKFELSPVARALLETRLEYVEDAALKRSFGLILALTRNYSALVTNPPYLGSGNLNTALKEYLEENYTDGKKDLFAAFIIRLLEMCKKGGRVGMITMQSWMFLSSFEELRCKILEERTILSMLHLGAHAFDSIGGEVTQTTAFILVNEESSGRKCVYRRLVDGNSEDGKHQLYLNPEYGRYEADQRSLAKIPGSPVAYWVSEKMVKAFEGKKISSLGTPRQGMSTCDVNRFVHFWHEVSIVNSNVKSGIEKSKWIRYNKGGDFRRWYGNRDAVVMWDCDGHVLKEGGALLRNSDYYFKPFIAWSKISSQGTGFRFFEDGFLFDGAGGSLFLIDSNDSNEILGLLNSVVIKECLGLISPTINFNEAHIGNVPISKCDKVKGIVSELISLSRSDWDEYETSWDFKVNPLVREGWQRGANGMRLEDAWEAVFKRRLDWTTRMKELEEENNRLFIEAYGLEDELTSDVEWKNVSITGNPFYRYKTDADLGAIGETEEEEALSFCASVLKKYPELEARARADAVKELLSYGLGVLMGRYSLEQEGLILASQGETYQDYLERVHGADKIHPDEDGVIPAIALEGDFFKDNLLLRMREFLAAAFGKETINDNLNFIEEALDCKIEKYLTEKLFAEHAKMYKKRPIYWLFQSPKGAFKIFAYMHRMTGATAGVIRNRYLLPYIAHLEKCFNAESAKGSNMTSAERKRVKAIEAAINDCKTYNLTLQAVADESISIDLDDGVVVNWEKYKSVLARL